MAFSQQLRLNLVRFVDAMASLTCLLSITTNEVAALTKRGYSVDTIQIITI